IDRPWLCRTSACRSLPTISSGLYRFIAISGPPSKTSGWTNSLGEDHADDTLWIGEIGRTRYKAFVSRSHPMANRKKISLGDLATETLILPEDGSLTQTLVRQRAADLGVALQRVVRTTTFPVVKEAILHGIGVGFMLEDGQFDSTNLVSLEIEEMGESYRNCLVTPREKRDLRLVSSFCDAVLDSM
ncbi:MAG: LysR family transcriptional regulator substrate-binding protein, partial [Alphaproteobacteria bacterium]|nr:LysR family transcriptional regulator substrate-binding protein [Alphaproteobacteria bacterium]